MEKLSIKQKAERYNKAIERAKKMFSDKEIDYLFPELKENEDGKMKKIISDILLIDNDEIREILDTNNVLMQDIGAWLEKLGKNNIGISEATKQELKDNLNKALEKETPESWNEFLDEQSEQNLVNTDLDELVIQLEGTIGTSPHSRETIKDFFQKTVQKYMNCLKIANGEIGSLIEENYRLKEKQGQQSIYDAPSRNTILAVWELGNKWKELTNGSISTEHGTTLDYIQKHWNESEYYLREKQREMKPTDKVEPKFDVGDWLIHNERRNIIKVVNATLLDYEVVDVLGYHHTITDTAIENNYHLWTIQDAKDGDVLSFYYEYKGNKMVQIGIIEKYVGKHGGCSNTFKIYVGVNWENNLQIGEYMGCSDIRPATKEQRDKLEKAITEAGYKWDAEHKQLKKIEDEPENFKQQVMLEMTDLVKDYIRQKPTDKVEPKFKVGDWIVSNVSHEDYRICKILKIENGEYVIESVYGYQGHNNFETFDKDYHLWTIQDAKDGDVLVYNDEISLYKHDIKNCTKQETTFGGFVYHCCYDGKRFITNSLYSLTEQNKTDIHLATKEQRNLLFSKMHEAGYEWDAEKKELCKQKVAEWGKKDEKLLNDAISLADEYYDFELRDWFKSLKDRVQPKQDWSEEDERMIASIIGHLERQKKYQLNTTNLEQCQDWLKSLIRN